MVALENNKSGKWYMGEGVGSSEPLMSLLNPQFVVKDKKAWDAFVDNANNARSVNVAQFARIWAEEIEDRMKDGQTLEDAAEQTLDGAITQTKIDDKDISVAVNNLNKAWDHGPELLKWFNR